MKEKDQPKLLLKWAAVLAGLGIVAVAIWVIWSRASTTQPVVMMCMTPGCGYQRQRALQVGETFPLVCPRCGKKSVAPAFRCPKCGTPNVWNEDRGLKPPTRCTKCGEEIRHGP